MVIRKRRYEKIYAVTVSCAEYLRIVLKAEGSTGEAENEVSYEMSQMADMSQLQTPGTVAMSQVAELSQLEQIKESDTSQMVDMSQVCAREPLSESTSFTANETNTESIGYSQNACVEASSSQLPDVSCTQQSMELTQVTSDSSTADINPALPSPTVSHSSPSWRCDTEPEKPEVVQAISLDTDKELSGIRRALFLLNKMRTVSYLPLRKKLLSILNLFSKLCQSERTEMTVKNQLSSFLLRLFLKLFECPTLNNNKLYELFKIGINCYVINFKHFTKADKTQLSLLFQFIFDLIFVNAKIKSYGKESYFSCIETHKVKNQLTATSNKTHLQILVYYLLELLFLLIEFKAEERTISDGFYIQNQLRKLLAFLILNGNAELIRLFRRNRSKMVTQNRKSLQ